MKETFGEYIRRNRTVKGFTLTQLAAKLNLDSANLSKIENGIRDFDIKRLEKLSIAFETEIELIQEEYFSDLIAKKIYENNCSENVLVLAEEKIKYYRTVKR
jgi:transcriptional regulator with XRE-family HTH domain